ncbi:hypothetical protein [Anaerosolibacter sp.]|uniref:hypothetical protein n=1 Tax=Anaerosolibacter sp. TaxID=1872527 RepID=UPI0039EED645
MSDERIAVPAFNFKDQMADIAQLIEKIGSLELDKHQEMYFLQKQEQRLQEEMKALEEKEEKLLEEYEDILIEMGSQFKAIKELKFFTMEERERCIKRYMELKGQGNLEDGKSA